MHFSSIRFATVCWHFVLQIQWVIIWSDLYIFLSLTSLLWLLWCRGGMFTFWLVLNLKAHCRFTEWGWKDYSTSLKLHCQNSLSCISSHPFFGHCWFLCCIDHNSKRIPNLSLASDWHACNLLLACPGKMNLISLFCFLFVLP